MTEICRRFRSVYLFGVETHEECGGVIIAFESTEQKCDAVDYICQKCGHHTATPLVVKNPQASSVEDDEDDDEVMPVPKEDTVE